MKSPHNHCHLTNVEHIVLFFCNGIGDAFMALPAMRALRKLFKKRITLICPEPHENWWYNELMFDEILPISFKLFDNHIEFNFHSLHQKVINVDIVISLITCESQSLNKLLKLWNPAFSCGFIGQYSFALKNYKTMNMFMAYFELVKLIGFSAVITDFSCPVQVPQHAIDTAKLFLESLISPGDKMLSLHMETKQNKMWNNNYLQPLLNQFLLEFPNYKVIIVGLHEMQLTNDEQQRVVSFFGFDLAIVSAIVSCSDVFLGVDSCMLHLADLARIPSIGLFGPTSCQRFGFYFTHHIHIASLNQVMDMPVVEVVRSLRALC